MCLLVCLVLVQGCQVRSEQTEQNAQMKKSKTIDESTLKRVEPKSSTTAKTETTKGLKDTKWKSQLEWRSWADGRGESAKTGKPLCLVVYTDWCPKCRKLGPLFQDEQVEQLAEQIVMVRQNQDEQPEWLTAYVEHGRYVPRIFFFSSNGALLADIKSPIDRYPYFYTPNSISAFRASLKKALSQK